MQTYDLACAGPNQRFTVLTEAGPIIVHNCMLASGYGMGAETLQRQLSVGLMGNSPLHIDMPTAEKWKTDYRELKPNVVRLWYRANEWITAMAEGKDIDFKMLRIREGRIELPNGLILRYPHLHQTPDGWTYRSQHGSYYKLWGGTLVQNVCEALARDVVITQCLHIARELPWVSSTHDEGVFVAPAERAEDLTPWVEDAMRTILPEWAKGWPIDAEAFCSASYDK
jgi:DNA polymerase bacteriophage-type